MRNFFKYEGTFYRLMNKLGNLMILNALFIVTSLPLVTLVSSFSALYYATVKTVRTENGYPVREYFAAFKRELKTGILLTVALLVIWLILYIDIMYVAQSPTFFGGLSFAVFILLLFISFSFFIYSPIVLSRFKLKTIELVKMALFMVFRHLPQTILLVVSYLVVALVLYLIPIPLLIFLPSLLMYGISFMTEKILRKYVKEDSFQNETKWFMELWELAE